MKKNTIIFISILYFCSDLVNSQESLVGTFYGGWALINGTYKNSEQMVIQTGFFNGGSFASRFVKGIEGDRYRRLNWDKVLLNKPTKVTIIRLVAEHEQNDIYDMGVEDVCMAKL